MIEGSSELLTSIEYVKVTAALDDHDLTPFEPAENSGGGYQARCRNCGKVARIGAEGLIDSTLDGKCTAEAS